MADSPKALAEALNSSKAGKGPDFYGAALAALNAGAPGISPDMRKALAANIALRCRATLRASSAESAASEREPPPGLLMSMAVRYDHGLGMPGYYDQGIFKLAGHTASHSDRLRSTLSTMHQLWEEVTGNGFYRPEKEADYVATRDRALSDQSAGGMPDA